MILLNAKKESEIETKIQSNLLGKSNLFEKVLMIDESDS